MSWLWETTSLGLQAVAFQLAITNRGRKDMRELICCWQTLAQLGEESFKNRLKCQTFAARNFNLYIQMTSNSPFTKANFTSQEKLLSEMQPQETQTRTLEGWHPPAKTESSLSSRKKKTTQVPQSGISLVFAKAQNPEKMMVQGKWKRLEVTTKDSSLCLNMVKHI